MKLFPLDIGLEVTSHERIAGFVIFMGIFVNVEVLLSQVTRHEGALEVLLVA